MLKTFRHSQNFDCTVYQARCSDTIVCEFYQAMNFETFHDSKRFKSDCVKVVFGTENEKVWLRMRRGFPQPEKRGNGEERLSGKNGKNTMSLEPSMGSRRPSFCST